MGERISVQTYSGFKADERPASLSIGERVVRVRDIIDRWYEVDHAYFRLVADDGTPYLVRHNLNEDAWELVEDKR